MELRHLEHFVAVAEEGSFTRGAARVHVVQSALSVSVRSLERELGVRLFDRTTHRVSMTDAGVALLPEARRTLKAAEEALDAVAAVRGVRRGVLRVGIMQSLVAVDLASLLARFRQDHPEVEIRLSPAIGGSAALAEDVRQGALDVAFLALPPEREQGLATVELALEPFLLAGAPGTLEPGRDPLSLAELARERFVDFPRGWATRAAADEAFAKAGAGRSVTIEVADVTTFLQLVQVGLGFGLLPRSLVPRGRRFSSRAVRPAPSWRIVMAVPAGRSLSSAARAFVGLVEGRLAAGLVRGAG